MTPTQRSLKHLREQGYLVEVVERVFESNNDFLVFGDHIKIFTSRGHIFLIDLERFDLLSGNRWCSNLVGSRVYAVRNIHIRGKKKKQTLHRLVCDNAEGMFVDHIDGNTFDNRGTNLRVVTSQQNTWNRVGLGKGFKGVAKHKDRFTARITVSGKNHYLGIFDTEIEAAKAYDKAAIFYFSEFSRTNKDLGLL